MLDLHDAYLIFDPKNIEGQGRRNGKGLEYTLGHTLKVVEG
jgi:hypothetical protein